MRINNLNTTQWREMQNKYYLKINSTKRGCNNKVLIVDISSKSPNEIRQCTCHQLSS